MRRLIVSALLLAAASPVLAQLPPPDVRDEHRDDRGGDRRDQGQRQDDRGQRPDDRGQRPDDRGQRQDDRGQRPDDRGQRPDDQGRRQDDRGGFRQDDRGGYRQDDRGFRGDDRGRQDERRDFGDDRRRYGDGDQYARFHGDAFYYPRGFGYRYYGIGTVVPRVFLDQRYYIGQPDYYRLPPAAYGTRWVRVGPDALLIRYNGRVVRIIRGLFY